MAEDQKRYDVKMMYPNSKRWAAKVDKMSDAQVYAIYMRNLETNSQPKEKR